MWQAAPAGATLGACTLRANRSRERERKSATMRQRLERDTRRATDAMHERERETEGPGRREEERGGGKQSLSIARMQKAAVSRHACYFPSLERGEGRGWRNTCAACEPRGPSPRALLIGTRLARRTFIAGAFSVLRVYRPRGITQ